MIYSQAFGWSLALLVGLAFVGSSGGPASGVDHGSESRILADIKNQTEMGPRFSGLSGHEAAVNYIQDQLEKAGYLVFKQRFAHRRSSDGVTLMLTNVVARKSGALARPTIVYGTHYDSIVRAYADRQNPQGYMPGANNSASGVAVLLELARQMIVAPDKYDVELVFFDGEEGENGLGGGDPNWFPLGSPEYIRQRRKAEDYKQIRAAVILDMVCWEKARFVPEANSILHAKELTNRLFEIGASEFPGLFDKEAAPQPIGDDQLAFLAAGIDATLLIAFEYGQFLNTTQDTVDKCSEKTLGAVLRTLGRFHDKYVLDGAPR